MEREQWAELSKALRDLDRSFTDNTYHTHSTVLIVRVYLWAVLHDRPTSWACAPRHWDPATRPRHLPSQSTMSRRLRTDAVKQLLERMSRRLAGRRGDRLSEAKGVRGEGGVAMTDRNVCPTAECAFGLLHCASRSANPHPGPPETLPGREREVRHLASRQLGFPPFALPPWPLVLRGGVIVWGLRLGLHWNKRA